jgi:hypothetical protein
MRKTHRLDATRKCIPKSLQLRLRRIRGPLAECGANQTGNKQQNSNHRLQKISHKQTSFLKTKSTGQNILSPHAFDKPQHKSTSVPAPGSRPPDRRKKMTVHKHGRSKSK